MMMNSSLKRMWEGNTSGLHRNGMYNIKYGIFFSRHTSYIKFWSSRVKDMLLREHVSYNAIFEIFVHLGWKSSILEK